MTGPRVIEGLAAIRDGFDAVLLDQWGVLHDGRRGFPGAVATLEALHRAGVPYLVLSNSARRAVENEAKMAALGLPHLAGRVLSSGEATWAALAAPAEWGLQGAALAVGAPDHRLTEGTGLARAATVAEAGFVLLTGVPGGADAVWTQWLAPALAAGLPLVCANPDHVTIEGTRRGVGPGALAARYQAAGGRVILFGKPGLAMFEAALQRLSVLAGRRVDPARVLMVGDSLENDVAGAHGAGMPALLVTEGMHRDALADAEPGALPERIAALAAGLQTAPPAFACRALQP